MLEKVKKIEPSEINSIRPETVQDTYGKGERYKTGTMPKGGFQSVWSWGDTDIHNSPTQKPGKKVY